MKIVVCGAGQVGYGIAQRLVAEGHEISVIDSAPSLIQAVRETLDARGIVGHGAYPEVLAEAGASDADMLIAVTLHDEVNMVACQVAHSLFSVPTKIARIRSRAYLRPHWQDLFFEEGLPIDVIISPEIEVGETVLRRIALPGAVDVVRFADDKIALVGIECEATCPIIDIPLNKLSERFPDILSTVVGIVRGGELVIPSAEETLKVGDLAYVVARGDQVRRTLDVFGHEEPKAGRIVIAGGGNIGAYVAREMEKNDLSARLRIVEADRERAKLIAEKLTRTIVIHGSALDHAILREADIDDADLMVALTKDDQTNILSAVMAKHLGCRSNLSLINDPAFHDLTRPLGIDAFINPRSITISKVLQHVRRGRIRSVHSIQNGMAEVIEAEAMETSPLVGRTLGELDLPRCMRIGAICREGKFIRPEADTRVRPSDRVVVFSSVEGVKKAEQLFRVSLEFF